MHLSRISRIFTNNSSYALRVTPPYYVILDFGDVISEVHLEGRKSRRNMFPFSSSYAPGVQSKVFCGYVEVDSPRGKSLFRNLWKSLRNQKSRTPMLEIPMTNEKYRTLNVEVIYPSRQPRRDISFYSNKIGQFAASTRILSPSPVT